MIQSWQVRLLKRTLASSLYSEVLLPRFFVASACILLILPRIFHIIH
ncbi:hypothetical protein OESDEN_21746 [Oesophagostomum dentatum]|uniref:Uncharacterized protein n=1 Tax=Oesophagostomum dentatum TaxID=61180 RepID=A0A0B1S454_OESDE|nr:hypothetical protein OESDEN_21746 [Oesophagostomum dentatum]